MKRLNAIFFLPAAILLSLSVMARDGSALSFEKRVEAREAVERVFYNHRIWPKDNLGPKPDFEASFPRSAIIPQVERCLKESALLEYHWHQAITPAQLQAEMDRIAADTKDPRTLLELFSSLGNDPYLIAECIARPIVSERLASSLYYSDHAIHSQTRSAAEEALKKLERGEPIAGADRQKMSVFAGSSRPGEFPVNDGSSPEIFLPRPDFENLLTRLPPLGRLSGILEETDRFLIVKTTGRRDGFVEYDVWSFMKRSFDDWLSATSPEKTQPFHENSLRSYNLPAIGHGPDPDAGLDTEMLIECIPPEGTWAAVSSANCPAARRLHTAVWTGAEMIVWGGYSTVALNSGGRYCPATDSWLPTSTGTNVPSARLYHTSVWTGSVMIVWGGGTNTGGRYNPVSNSWLSTSTGANCPSARSEHTAIWTGSSMIVWGGNYSTSYFNSGGIYDPSANSWTAVSTGPGVPLGRSQHSAVWADGTMIVWGGRISGTLPYNTSTGGRYLPSSDSWTSTQAVGNPAPRALHTAVWTGSEMIVWGGLDANGAGRLFSGGKYDLLSDLWTPTSEIDVPEVRAQHSAVWTGNRMIVWGGQNDVNYINTGASYDPLSDTWKATSTSSGVPSPRNCHTAVWTGSFMIVWGGGYPVVNNGGIFCDSPIPPLGFANNTAADLDSCADSGVTVSWTAPTIWADGGVGTRSFDLLRDGSSIVSGLDESVLTFTDNSGSNGVSYLYQVRATGGCGASSVTSGVRTMDTAGSPAEVSNLTPCGWSAVEGATSYRLYRGLKADLPNLLNSTADACIIYEGNSTSSTACQYDDPSLAAGKLYWYLVTALRGTCEGTAGSGTGFARNLSSSGACSDK